MKRRLIELPLRCLISRENRCAPPGPSSGFSDAKCRVVDVIHLFGVGR